MSSQACIVCGPKCISRALCNCCQEYDRLLNAQLEPLALEQLRQRTAQHNK